MNSLMNYGSDDDDDYEESGDEKRVDSPVNPSKTTRKNGQDEDDANYDEVQMDLSEDSNDSAPKNGRESNQRPESSERDDRDRRRSPKDYRRRERRDDAERSSRSSRDRDDRHRYEDSRSDRYRDEERRDRRSNEDDRNRDRNSRDDRYGRRDRRRSRSRERRRSRSPKRERSRSAERNNRGYTRRQDRTNNKMDRLDKMGIEIKTPDSQFVKPSELQKTMNDEKANDSNKDRFFMPGITGRFRDQIERRKLLWQKKEPEVARPSVAAPTMTAGSSRATKVWETTTFAQDTDGKVASKFKRLMGIRNADDGSRAPTDVLKKQEEMFSSMEQQYEVARTATHTMRGVGLGFGSFQR